MIYRERSAKGDILCAAAARRPIGFGSDKRRQLNYYRSTLPPRRPTLSQLDRRLARVESRIGGITATLGMLTKGLLALQGQLDVLARGDGAEASVGPLVGSRAGVVVRPKLSKRRPPD